MADQRGDHQEPVEPRQSIEVAVGEVVELPVEDLPGAGYRWLPGDLPEGLVLLDDVVEPPVGTRVGGPSRRILRVRPVAEGMYRLEIVLVRPWEPADVPPARRRVVTVTAVRPAPPRR